MVKRLLASFILGFCLLNFSGVGMSQEAGEYVASKHSNKYHYVWCKWAKKINPDNLIVFHTAKEAQAAGYVPCKVCKPPVKD
jgi:hypothetical protein